MEPGYPEPQQAADMLLYEAEAADGFLNRLVNKREFHASGWQRIWTAVASLMHHHNGEFNSWEQYDLIRIIGVVQEAGQALDGRVYGSLDEFEIQILEANIMLREMLE